MTILVSNVITIGNQRPLRGRVDADATDTREGVSHSRWLRFVNIRGTMYGERGSAYRLLRVCRVAQPWRLPATFRTVIFTLICGKIES